MPTRKDAYIYMLDRIFWLTWMVSITVLAFSHTADIAKPFAVVGVAGGFITSSYLAYRTSRLTL